MSDVINFPGTETFNDIDPKEMVKNAMEEFDFDSVLLIGRQNANVGGAGITVCTSSGDTAEIIFHLELAKKAILDATEC